MDKDGIDWTEAPALPASSDPHYDEPPEPMPDHGIRAVLFDLDGTLVDAREWHRMAFDSALEKFGYQKLDYDDHIENFDGLSSMKKLSILASRGVLPRSAGLFKDINDVKQQMTYKIIDEMCKPIPRVIDVLTFLKSAGYKIGLVTNCSRKSALQMCELSRLGGFDVVITNDDVGERIKPSPYPYISAQYSLGLKREECLSVDDTSKGVMSILGAGHRLWRLDKFEDLNVRNLMRVMNYYRITI